jgi:hypothetical protein
MALGLTFEIKGNFSAIAKELHSLGRRVYPAAGRAMRLAMEREYERLLHETPQYSGTTVASYRMGFRAPAVKDELPKPKTMGEAFQRGAGYAIGRAQAAYDANPLTDDFDKWKTADVTVTNGNDQEAWEVAEYGPVRPINEPVGAFNDFEGRLRELIINVDISKDLV